MSELKDGLDFAALSKRFEAAEDALRGLLDPGQGALKAKEELEEARKALDKANAEAKTEMTAVAKSAHAALERSQTAIEDVTSQARQQSRTLTDIARDLKDAADMLNRFKPDEIASRLDAINADGKKFLERLDAQASATQASHTQMLDRLNEAAASRTELSRRLRGLRRIALAGLLLALSATALGALATAPLWIPIIERARAALSDAGY